MMSSSLFAILILILLLLHQPLKSIYTTKLNLRTRRCLCNLLQVQSGRCQQCAEMTSVRPAECLALAVCSPAQMSVQLNR